MPRRRLALCLYAAALLTTTAALVLAEPVTPAAPVTPGNQPDAANTPPPVVILISWDGVRHDYPDLREYPALGRMAREGVRAKQLVPVFPASTFPNHVSLATGTYPDRHGILDNDFYDRERRAAFSYDNDAVWLDAEPLWVAAERQGRRAATFFWVGSETDWNGVGASDRMSPFDRSIREDAKVDQIVAWLDRPREDRPQLIMCWWRGSDRTGHRKGPDHPDNAEALQDQDDELARLFAQLDERNAWPHTTVIVVSDHGMTLANQPVDIETPLESAGIQANVVPGTGIAHFFLQDQAQLERAVKVLGRVDNAQTYRRETLPPALRYHHASRTGDLVAITQPPHFFRKASALDSATDSGRRLVGWSRGGHGFAPEHPDMRGILFAIGRGISPDRELAEVRAIDVAPSVAALLGIDPPLQSEGRSLFEVAATPEPSRLLSAPRSPHPPAE